MNVSALRKCIWASVCSMDAPFVDSTAIVLQGCLYGVNAPQVGWPTLQLVPFVTELKPVNVNVLGITSRKKTQVVKIQCQDEAAEAAAHKLVGRICFAKYATALDGVHHTTEPEFCKSSRNAVNICNFAVFLTCVVPKWSLSQMVRYCGRCGEHRCRASLLDWQN